ncbi:uncharacterized protein LOC120344596 isoform X2 [Styela clava]
METTENQSIDGENVQDNPGEGQSNMQTDEMPENEENQVLVPDLNQLLRGRFLIAVNHTYNIHYPEELLVDDRAVEYYGQLFVREINKRTLDEIETEITPPIELPSQPVVREIPELIETRYFSGMAGVERNQKYIPDAKYIKHYRREVKGNAITLEDLHFRLLRSECNHVALVGPPGCGKTVLLKIYAKMVLNRQVPALHHIEVVHYVDVSKLYQERNPTTFANMLLERMIVLTDEKIYKYGMKWITENEEKILFIFDGVADVIKNFHYPISRINNQSETTIEVVLQNFIAGYLLPGCRTLISAREWAWKNLKGDSRPQKFVVVKPMTENQKVSVTKSLLPVPGLQGEEFNLLFARRFPMAFQLFDDVLFQYFALSALMEANHYKQKEIASDVLLVSQMMQLFLRSSHSSNDVIESIRKLKPLALDLMKRGIMRFGDKEIKSHAIEDIHMADFITMAPQHRHGVIFRLFPCDFSYHFSNQVIFDFFAAAATTTLSLEEFKELLSTKLHTDEWIVVRKFLCGFLLNEKTRKNLAYYVKSQQHHNDLISSLKSSLTEQLQIKGLTQPQRFELLASLHECGESVQDIVKSFVKIISLPDISLSPSDLYIISQIAEITEELQKVDLCLGEDINLREFNHLLSRIVPKCDNITLNIARFHIALEHIDIIKDVLQKNNNKEIWLCFLVHEDTPALIMARFPHSRSSSTQSHVTVERITVPDDERN